MATKTRPTEVPITTEDRPPEPTAAELALAQSGTTALATRAAELDRPTFEPPGTAAGAAATAAAAGWLTNKHVLMLWQTAGATDGWAYFDGGIGWRRLSQAADIVTRGLGVLAAGGRCSGGVVHAYEGAGGTIEGMYLW
jgi:hypothetical protein